MRERSEDVAALTDHLLRKWAAKLDLPARVSGDSHSRSDLADDDAERPLDELVREATERIEAGAIRERLRRLGGHRTRTAASLGIGRKTLFKQDDALRHQRPERRPGMSPPRLRFMVAGARARSDAADKTPLASSGTGPWSLRRTTASGD